MQVKTGVRHSSLRLLHETTDTTSHHGIFRYVAQELTQMHTSPVLRESLSFQMGTTEFRYLPAPPTDSVYDERHNVYKEIPGEEPPCSTELKRAIDELKTLRRISRTWKWPHFLNDRVANYLVTVTEHTPEAGQAVATILQAGECDGDIHRAFKSLSADMRKHDHVIMVALENNGGAIIEKDSTGFYSANKRYVMQAIRSDTHWLTHWFRHAYPTMYADKEVILCYLDRLVRILDSTRGYHHSYLSGDVTWILSKVPAPFLLDREIAMAAVKADGTSLKRFSDDLQHDRVLVHIAVNSSSLALRDVLPKFRQDRDIVSSAVQKYPTALQFAAPHLRSDRSIVEEAIRKEGTTLHFADDVLKNDSMLAIRAIGQNPRAYHYISDRLKLLPILVLLAAKKCPQVLRSAPPAVLNNRELMAAIVSTHEVVDNIYDNLELMTPIVSTHEVVDNIYDNWCSSQYAIAYINPILKNDYEIAKVAVQTHGRALQHLPDKYRNNETFAYWAIAQDPNAYRFISNTLEQSRQLAIQTVRHPKASLEIVADHVLPGWYNNKVLVLEAATRSYPGCTAEWHQTHSILFGFRGRSATNTDRFRRIAGDPDIVLAMIKVHGLRNLKFACSTLTNDPEFVYRILADYHELRGRDNGILDWIGYKLRQDMPTMLYVISKCTAPVVWLMDESLCNSVEFWERLLTMQLRVANRQSLIDDIPDTIKEDSRIASLLSAKKRRAM